MMNLAYVLSLAAICGLSNGDAKAEDTKRSFPAKNGGTLTLDLQAGGSVEVIGDEVAEITVSYTADCTPECEIEFDADKDGLTITSDYVKRSGHSDSDVVLHIVVPKSYDIELQSMGGGLTIDGVAGKFSGHTNGGELILRNVQGNARLETMGGQIEVTDSELDGSLSTMGGEVSFENVVGDVRGSSMGGNVRYKNVTRRNGETSAPEGMTAEGKNGETVQISTMGGEIEIEVAPEGADLSTMGGQIAVRDAHRFVRAKTMGGNISIDSIDGWVDATTMGGDIEVTVTGDGGDVSLTSMSGTVTLFVPKGFGMDLELEVAFTRNSSREFNISTPGGPEPTVTPEWDYDHGSPRKYIRSGGTLNGGGHKVKITTVNGDIVIEQEVR